MDRLIKFLLKGSTGLYTLHGIIWKRAAKRRVLSVRRAVPNGAWYVIDAVSHNRSLVLTCRPMSLSENDVADASRRYFNNWATGYDRSWAQIWFRENHRLIVQAVDPPRDACILDLGCGTGQLAARLAEHVPDGGVVGIDPAEEMIRIAREHQRDRSNVRFELGSSDAIPADAGTFDVAVSTISFHHWTRPADSLREIARVLKPKGRVLILDLCRDRGFMEVFDRLQRWLQPSHAGMASTRDMRAYCSHAGFRNIQISKPRWLLMLTQVRLDECDTANAPPNL